MGTTATAPNLLEGRLVLPVGPSNARIALVGEAPGRQEVLAGVPFVGASGRLLDRLLAKAGIRRSDCYITNVVKIRPPNNDFTVFYEDKLRRKPRPELIRWWDALAEELRSVRPNVIVALGAEALRGVTRDVTRSIGDWRGSIIATPLGKCVPTYHPAMVLRQYSWSPIVLFDLKRAAAESLTPELSLPKRELLVGRTLSEIRDFIEHARSTGRIAFDVETIRRGDPPRTLADCVGIAVSPELAMCIPICHPDGTPFWTLADEAEVWRMLGSLFADPNVQKIAQNGQYDILILRRHGVRVVNFWLDTMNLANTVYPEFPKGLDFLASIFTREPYWKHTITTDRWRYNATDAAVTYEVALKLLEDAREFGVERFYFEHVHPLIPIYIEVQERGVRIDQAKLAEACEALRKEIDELQRRLNELVGHELNVHSPKQMRDFLYRELRLRPKYAKSGGMTANEEAIKALQRESPHPALGLILELREKKKLLSTYLEAPCDADGRMRSTYNVAGTETGRLASRESVDGTGTNLQNVPHGIARQVFVPDPGNVFVGADLSQAEARVVAWLAKDEFMIRVFTEGRDIHKENAARIFRKPIEEITPDERYLAKRLVHAANYGLGPRKFAQIAEVPERMAKELLAAYFRAFPRIQEWHRSIEQQIRKTRTLSNPFGRKRRFHDRIGPDLYREAYAYIPQSTVADQLHRATRAIWARLPEGARIALQVHDSIVIECAPHQVEEVKAILKEELERPIDFGNGMPPLVIPAEIKVGDNWDAV